MMTKLSKGIKNIFLIGPMGAGKTTIGRYLAKRLQLQFFDADQYIEQQTGADISWIFDIEGEQGFRRREAKAIAELTSREGIVLATGGGAILDGNSRELLHQRGTVIYLRASIEQQLKRTSRGQKRPLLMAEDPRQVLQSVAEQRHPLYEATADLIYDTDNKSPYMVADQIIRDLEHKS